MPSNYPEIYFPVLVQIPDRGGLGASVLILASTLLGKRARSPLKDTPYESGMAPTGSARERFSVKFYMVGMIFILFDIEAVFLYPWAVVYRDLKLFGFFEMLIFVVLVLVRILLRLKKGALDCWRSPGRREERRLAQMTSRGRFSKPRKLSARRRSSWIPRGSWMQWQLSPKIPRNTSGWSGITRRGHASVRAARSK